MAQYTAVTETGCVMGGQDGETGWEQQMAWHVLTEAYIHYSYKKSE
jgi:hypothetical protein